MLVRVFYSTVFIRITSSLVAQMLNNPPAMQETWVQSLGWEDPLEEVMATHSSILAWRIPMKRRAWWATVPGLQRVTHNWVTKHTPQYSITPPTSACMDAFYKLLRSCLTLCDPMDCGPPGSSVSGILRQEYWSGSPCPPPEELPNPGIKPTNF